jgi:predicted MFS family arabinose efflux permease
MQTHHSNGELTRASLRRAICGLGIAQILSWGSLYYTIAVVGENMRRDLGVSETLFFGAFTLSLFLSGLAAPAAGRLIDEKGGRPVLAAGSLLAALALLLLATATGPVMLALGSAVSGVAMAACLYDAAFTALNELAGASYRKAVTAVTLFGGFASTVFWPLSQVLMDAIGWRETLAVYAALQAFVCLPIHLWLLPRRPSRTHVDVKPDDARDTAAAADASDYAWLALAFAMGAFVFSAMSVHLITLLKSGGLAAADAVIVAALIGPMQVLGRIIEFTFARNIRPVTVGTMSFLLMLLALLSLLFVQRMSPFAFVFAALYGFSNGIMTIVRGTVPAELYGRVGYGALLGRLARPAFIAKAVAPVMFSLAVAAGLARSGAILALAGCSAISLAAYLVAIRKTAARRGETA